MADNLREKYRQMNFNSLQITQILDGQEKGLDTSVYEDNRFDWEQMEQIKLGLEEGLRITYYAYPDIPVAEMRKIRSTLKKEKEQESDSPEKRKTLIKGASSLLMAAGVVFITAILIGIIFMFKDRVMLSVQDLSLVLKEEEITLDFQQQFNAADYIESYTKGNSIELILPEEVDTSVLGSQSVTYSLTNGAKTISRNLIINVVDREPPVLKLKYSKVTLHDYDSFEGLQFIETATDNCDGDLTESVSFGSLDRDLEKQKIHYSVSDSSGNLSETDLLVVIDETLPAEAPAEEGEEGETEENDPVPTEVPQQEQPSATSQPEQHGQQEYEETKIYEENGGTTTCIIHHYANGSTTESCEWVGPWEEY